jgi:hypothetical protein
MGDHFAAFAILHASISKTLKTLRDFSREKKHKTIYDRAAFQELISPFEKCGVELQQRLDTVSDIYAFLVSSIARPSCLMQTSHCCIPLPITYERHFGHFHSHPQILKSWRGCQGE